MAYNPHGVSDFEAHLDLNDLAYTKFLRKFAGESPAAVTRKEHTAFLLYWLCHNLLCTRELASSRASEYSEVWYSFLATRDLHVGLKSRSKLLLALSYGESNRLRRFFKLVSFRPNHTGVVGFRYTVTWDHFTDRVFSFVTQQAIRKTIHPLTPFPSKDFSIDTAAPSAPGEESEETSDHTSNAPPSSSAPIPTSSSVLASEKRPIEPEQSTPLSPPKRRKSVAEKSYSKRAEDTLSADVPEKTSVPDEPISIAVINSIG
uniref:Uncharacterized protein n=1 Tax=Ananas comosus var. bracteatus TaxID=296719 RepID=A0A6V7QMJ4_ANACO|nr:unnamed protein product [Ananas comosus var. bracteatus]